MDTRLDDVNELLRLKKGDQGRLEHIKKALEAGTTLFTSDSKYLETLTEHLSKNVNESEPQKTESDKISFCAKCGAKLELNNNFCTKCGSSTLSDVSKKENYESSLKVDKPKKKGRSKKKKLGIGFGVIILLFFVLGSIPSDTDEPTVTNEQPKVKSYSQMNDKELVSIQIDWQYRDLLRNIDDYSGKIIFVEGKVTNVQRDIGSINLCTNGYTDYGVFFCEEYMFVNVNGITTWLEDDKLSGFVEVKRLSETGTNNMFTGGEWVGSGNYVPKVNEVRLICGNC